MENPALTKDQAAANWEAYNEVQNAFAEVSAMMRETPVHKSEIPPENDKHSVTRVELPDSGGVLVWMKSEHNKELESYPYEGFPLDGFVQSMDGMKKLVRGMMSGLFHAPNRSRLLFALPATRQLLYSMVYTLHRLVMRYLVKPHRYSTAVRELHRAFSAPQEDDAPTKELRYMLRDIVCMTLDADNAYRFRAQDILGELRKEVLGVKELKRLCKLAASRETGSQVRDTWKLLGYGIDYLRFDKKLRNMVIGVLAHLNIELVKLSPGDQTYCKPRKDYVFGFMQSSTTNV